MASIITKGRAFDFVFLLLAVVSVLVVWYLTTKRKWKAFIRKLPAADGLEEAVGRCAEMGKGFYFSTLCGAMSQTEAAQTLAGLAVLSYVSRLTARFDVPLKVGVMIPETIPLIDDICRVAYTSEGKIKSYNPERTILFLSPHQWGLAAAAMGIIQREKPAGIGLIGETRGEILIYLEPAVGIGITVAGTATMTNIQFCAIASDYSVIGDEMYALAAWSSGDPLLTNTMFAEDIIKFGLAAYVFIGLLTCVAGVRLLYDVLSI